MYTSMMGMQFARLAGPRDRPHHSRRPPAQTARPIAGLLGPLAGGKMETEILKTIENYLAIKAAWETHPDYTEDGPPQCVGIFLHPPGRGDHTESYIIGSIEDVITQIEWGERKLGEFDGLHPLWDGIPVDPYMITVISLSLKSKAAQAKAARDRLKEILPKNLRGLISKARRANYRPKYDFLPPHPDGKNWREHPEDIPEWYRSQTKDELFLSIRLTDQERDELSRWIDPLDFWKCATGRIPHTEVERYIRNPLQSRMDL